MAEQLPVDWRSEAFRRKVIAQIDDAVRMASTPMTKSSMEMENHVFMKAKTREEYLALVARLILHVQGIIGTQNSNVRTVDDLENFDEGIQPRPEAPVYDVVRPGFVDGSIPSPAYSASTPAGDGADLSSELSKSLLGESTNQTVASLQLETLRASKEKLKAETEMLVMQKEKIELEKTLMKYKIKKIKLDLAAKGCPVDEEED